MYITPTVIGLSNGSPVLPSYRTVFPFVSNPAICKHSSISSSDAPSNTGVATFQFNNLAAAPK